MNLGNRILNNYFIIYVPLSLNNIQSKYINVTLDKNKQFVSSYSKN
mgnify:FL=1